MPTRRFIFLVLACICCGIIINISVAWWFSLRESKHFSNPVPFALKGGDTFILLNSKYRRGFQQVGFERRSERSPALSYQIARDMAETHVREGSSPFGRDPGDVFKPTDTWPSWLPLPPDDGLTYDVWQGRACGWPLLSLTSLVYMSTGDKSLSSTWQFPIFDRSRSADQLSVRSLPLRPIPIGFVLNSLIFASPFAVVPLSLAVIRRMKRHRADHCKSCGYSLAGLPPNTPCPECNSAAAT